MESNRAIPMQGAQARRLVVEFTKMTGAGNDFIVVDNRFYNFSAAEIADMARRLCPRRTGVGADGILALEGPDRDGVDFRMRYHNADGSVGTMCGNGARCLARYAYRAGIERDVLRFSTEAGVYEAVVPGDPAGPVRLFLPAPADYRAVEPGAHPDMPEGGHYIWTGTEHLVLFVASVDDAPVGSAGPRLRGARTVSTVGANVNFVEVVDAGRIRVRTFEKGVEAETLACGTGAIASAVVACVTGRTHGGTVHVAMPGGTLSVGIEGDPLEPDRMMLEGPADTVFRGTFEY